MRRLVAAAFLLVPYGAAQSPWAGDWITDSGAMALVQTGVKVEGTYGEGGKLAGTVEGSKLGFTYSSGQSAGEGSFEIGKDNASFEGSWRSGGNRGTWRGWRKDAKAEQGKPADFGGFWLSSLGALQLTQKGKAVQGTYGAQGWGKIEGEVRGRRLLLTWQRLDWSGKAWLEQTPDGARVFGLTAESPPATWIGIRVKGFEPHAKPKPGEIVQGRAKNGMLYFLRLPKSWKKGTPVDTIVLLHGSNWTTKGMVHVTAQRWPELAERCAILGLQGEQWASWSDADDLRFNYTYVNWMGCSTYKGYPYTDRESPTLVVEVLDELKRVYGLGRLFVGGHSQGGFLTYLLHMHYPEKWAGTFPIAGGLVMQAEPDVFEDAKLLAAQRAVPMAIVHGRDDQVVEFSTGEYCRDRFQSHGFSLMRFFAPPGGHAYDFLPVGEVLQWLEVMSGRDSGALLAMGQASAAALDWRDVAACLVRAKALGAEAKLAPVAAQLEAEAAKAAALHLAAIEKNADGTWIDAYLEWQDAFEPAAAAQAAVTAFRTLQSQHDPKAKQLMSAARQSFNEGRREAGWQKYQEIVDTCYAAKCYRTVKRWLANRR